MSFVGKKLEVLFDRNLDVESSAIIEYFQDKNAKPLKTGPALAKQIFE